MKRMVALLLVILLLCSGCKPAGDEKISVGTEDGGGSGYGVSTKSVLKLSDFYFLTHNATRENNLQVLGTPVYTLGESDTYQLEDGSKIVLTYDSKGVLADTMYTSAQDSKNYGLFDVLVQQGVLKETATPGQTETVGQQSGNNGGSTDSGDTTQGTQTQTSAVFSTGTFRKAAFDSGLSLYLDRTVVVATFGSPSYFLGRAYTKDSYIIDCYKLDDGGVMMLDYGYDRKSLRCAAIRGADGITTTYLGTWSAQSKPADFVRTRIQLNQVTALSKNASSRSVYEKLGEPAWFEGTSTQYRDVYLIADGSTVYLSYDKNRDKLMEVQQLTTEGKLLEVALG